MAKTIVFQGDSITDAGRSYDRTIPANEALGLGYVFMTAAALRSADPATDWQIYNRGISGNRIVDLYARWAIDAINIKPDILSILIGVNDTWHGKEHNNGIELPRFDKFYRMIMDWTKEALPETKIVLMEPFVLLTGSVQEDWLAEMDGRREITGKIAEDYGALFLPTQEILNKAAKSAAPSYWLADGVHPTMAGHKLISDEWLKLTEGIR